jgi:cell division protein FtsW
VIFAWRGLRIAHAADTPFGSFIVIGVVIWVIGQMLLNVMAIMAMIPFTGVPVPFLSVGGSSLVSLLIACGVVVSVARGSRMLREDTAPVVAPFMVGNAKGGGSVRASATIRGGNGRARFARAHRAKGAGRPAQVEGADATIIGRDIRAGGVLRRRIGRHNASPFVGTDPGAVRWRRKRDGA